jgi:hypothetical protein
MEGETRSIQAIEPPTPMAADCSNHDGKLETPTPVAPLVPQKLFATSPTKAKHDELDMAVDRIIAAQNEAPKKRGRRPNPMRPPPSIVVDSMMAPVSTGPAQGINKAAEVFQMGTPTSRETHFIGTPTGRKDCGAKADAVDRPQCERDDASITLNEQAWPSDLVIRPQMTNGPSIRELLPSTGVPEESACVADPNAILKEESAGVPDCNVSQTLKEPPSTMVPPSQFCNPKASAAAVLVAALEFKPEANKRSPCDKHIRKCKVIEDGFNLACALEAKGNLKEAAGQFKRTFGICSTLLGERAATDHKSMRELKSRTSAALERLRGT